jgi:hypothetical protein
MGNFENRRQALKDLQELTDKAAELKDAESLFLRRSGWRHTCATPGSMWMWTKQIKVVKHYPARPDGKRIEITTYDALCTTDTAIYIEHSLLVQG